MILFDSAQQCCGCTACMAVCPTGAISMETDAEGFYYPKINSQKCVNCGKCRSVCSFQNGYNKNTVLDAYAIKHKDEKIRLSSRSGAAFILISDAVLEQGGAVYGAAFEDDFSVSHRRADTKTERDAFKGSKYVQSHPNNTFSEVKHDLDSGKTVLFSGTGCQVGGLLSFLEKTKTSAENLFTVDLVCHGVPSNKVWLDFLDYTRRKNGAKSVTKADFRDKSFGWAPHFESVWTDGEKHSSKDYAMLFYANHILRPSCYECIYANCERPSDFTLADFWGVDSIVPDFNDDKGVSLFFVNTQKGQKLFDSVKQGCEYKAVEAERCTKPNPNLRRTTPKPNDRDAFWKMYAEKGFDKTIKTYKRKNYAKKIKAKLHLP